MKNNKLLQQTMVHIVIPFSRYELKDTLIKHYKPMGVILHPILYEDEAETMAFPEAWVDPFIILEKAPERHLFVSLTKINRFIKNASIIDDDYYLVCSDLTGFESDVFKKIKQMEDDVVFISLKRGERIPPGVPSERAYPTHTLYARPDSVALCCISGEQLIIKGNIFKQHLYNEASRTSDGEMAVFLKEKYPIRYEPDLFALFHYFEEGRY